MSYFRFYHISEQYIRYLHSADPRVQYNKGQRRPYVGIVLSINSHDYYVPLESPKPNHKNLKNKGPILKLDEGNLGIMGFNNMIPVRPECLISFDIQQVQDEKYKMLLINQLAYCNRHKGDILQKAQSTYVKTVKGKVPAFTSVCCDFKKLERKSRKFDINFRKKNS